MNKICVIDYGINNISSVCKALKKLNIDFIIVSEGKKIKNYSKIILPGVGSFDSGMKKIKEKGLDISLKEVAFNGNHILGICLGMQLLFDKSEESNCETEGLSIIKGNVSKIKSDNKNKIFVPHVGWNSIFKSDYNDTNLVDTEQNMNFYFVNSYYVIPENKKIIQYYFKHGANYPAIIKNENIFATQFHPEKSNNGLSILKKFSDYE
tara:strand:+ start:9518 stop:10141 length:624 start_codon:yes stop_codon:yes gene_type:complete